MKKSTVNKKGVYDTSLKRKWDEESIRQSAIIERERAREEGKEAEKRAIALELKKMGIPVADIAKGTGLSIEAIEKLK